MKKLSASKLKIISDKYCRKKKREEIIKNIKQLNSICKKYSKRGEYSYFNSIREEYLSSHEMFVALRWFRLYSELDIDIKEEVHISSLNKRYIERMIFTIKW